MAGTSRPCQRHSRGPAKLKDGFRIMFRLLYTASERVAKRAGFCVDCWLRSLLATPLRFEPYHDVFPSWPAPPGLASGIRADQRSSKMASGSCFACCTQRASELRKEQVFVSIAGCAACWRRRCDLSRTTTFSHHGRHLQALPAAFARTSEAQRWLQDHVSPAVHSERASCEKSRFLCRLLAAQPAGDAVAI